MSNEEIFEVVDETGKVVGHAPRSECHRNPGLLHQVVHVLVLNSAGDLILQLRSPDKDIQPGKWDTSVGGHMASGEEPEDAARREMAEELGITPPDLKFLYRYIWRSDRESELVYTYTAVHEGELTPDPVEVSEVKAWPRVAIIEALGKGIFTPNFEVEWQMLNTV